jgi:hypothetical protein
VEESVEFLRAVDEALTPDRIAEIDRLLQAGDATRSARWMRDFVFGAHRGGRNSEAKRHVVA